MKTSQFQQATLRSSRLSPVHKEIDFNYPKQLAMFPGAYNSHIQMGYFYELLTMAVFGGELIDSLPINGRIQANSNKPDVISHPTRSILESKALRMGHHLTLLKRQYENYKAIQLYKPSYKIFYVVWRHTFKKIKSFEGDLMDVFKETARTVVAGIVIPLSLIRAAYLSPAFRHYDGRTWYECTSMSSTAINRLFLDTAAGIRRLDLNPSDYIYTKVVCESLTVGGFTTPILPITFILDRSQTKWLDTLRSEEVPF